MSDELFGGVVNDASSQNAFNFGLNPKVKLLKFEYNPAYEFGNSGNTAALVEIQLDINGLKFDNIMYEPKKEKKDGSLKTKEEFNKEKDETLQKIFHIAKCFADKTDIIAAVAGPPSKFGEYIDKIKSVWGDDWQEKELDVFLQWQWSLKGSADKKYLELPKHAKQGAFLIPHVEGDFQQITIQENGTAVDANGTEIGKVDGKTLTVADKEFNLPSSKVGLCFIDVSAGTLHPFTKTNWFMESGWANADDGSGLDTWD